MENSKKMGVALAVNTTGAILAYLIGAGFASGQEIMQYFCKMARHYVWGKH